jgi:hypothetical protein
MAKKNEALAALNAASETQETDKQPETAAAPEPEAPSELTEIGSKCFIFNGSGHRLRDPYTGDKFPTGKTIRVKELGSWTHSQLVAGLLKIGKEENVGVEPEDNTDA